MALIKCPECGKTISDKSSHCVHCGCPVIATDIAEHPTVDSPNEEYSQEESQTQENFVLPEGETNVTETTPDKITRKNKIKHLCTLFIGIALIFFIIGISCFFMTKLNGNKLIMGEWDFSAIFDGDSLFTASKLKAFGLTYNNSAVFNEDDCTFSFMTTTFKGKWNYKGLIAEPESGEKFYTYVLTDEKNSSCMATIKENDENTLIITLTDDSSSIILTYIRD